jgi:hypothetical protein
MLIGGLNGGNIAFLDLNFGVPGSKSPCPPYTNILAISVFLRCLTPNLGWSIAKRWKEFTIEAFYMYNKRICFFGRDDVESDSRELFGTVAMVLRTNGEYAGA